RLGRHPTHQTLRAMGIQIIHYDMPARRTWVAPYHPLKMRQEIGFSTGWACRWRQKLATGYIAAQDKRARTMPNILELASLDFARCQGQIFLLALQGLDTSHFVGRDHPFSPFSQGWGLPVHSAYISNLGVEPIIYGRGQPVADQVRFESPLLSRREAWRREMLGTILRVMISSASSRLLHWLIGRAPWAGGSQASATIWQTCSALMVTGLPERGASVRRCSSGRSVRGTDCKPS